MFFALQEVGICVAKSMVFAVRKYGFCSVKVWFL